VGWRESIVGDEKLEEGFAGCLAAGDVACASWPARLGSLKGRVGEPRALRSIVRAHRAGLHLQGVVVDGSGVGRRWV
jgi:hypothetical protein